MNTPSYIPIPLDQEPIKIVEKIIIEIECPNPACREKLNITNLRPLIAIKCPKCNNVTLVPLLNSKWWQRTKNFIISIIIAIISSILATVLLE